MATRFYHQKHASNDLVDLLRSITRFKQFNAFELLTLLLSCLLSSGLNAAEKSTNFRVGVGSNTLNITDTGSSISNLESTGFIIVAEYPQDKYKGSRFLIHYAENDESEIFGYETQLLVGYGLDAPGFRIHTGPLWHRDHNLLKMGSGDFKQKSTGWGWQLGLGYQHQRWIIELSSTIRESDDYKNLSRELGSADEHPKITHYRLLFSRQF